MASCVFFRFKSSKEPTRVPFDGTGISVFELKRDIITISKLGDGTDFELILSSEDGDDVYNDDTTIIPRSTTVVAKRLPAAKPGRGGAARYVSGKMPVNAKNTHRSENHVSKSYGKVLPPKTTNNYSNVSELQTEEERMAAVMKLGADQWEQQQQEMANVTPVHRSGPMKGKPVNVPDRPPPPGYVCYRCGEKGHWIQVCPTNDDPNFEKRPRIKRTTGIPNSFLVKVEKPTSLAGDGTGDDVKPSGVMVNANGDWVIAEPDKASWERFQARAKVSAAAQEEANRGSKELQDRGLECSIDKQLFLDPTKTPCCQTTYCNECITNALLDDDLKCPGCGKEGILIDDLTPDTDMVTKIHSYEDEKIAAKKEQEKPKEKEKEKEKSPVVKQETNGQSPKGRTTSKSPGPVGKSPSPTISSIASSKKRPADTELESEGVGPGPTERAPSISAPSTTTKTTSTTKQFQFPPELAFLNQPPFSGANMMPSMSSMLYPNVNAFMPVGPMMPMNMNPAILNTMMPPVFPMAGMPNQWPPVTNNGMFPQLAGGMYSGGNPQMGMMPNTGGYGMNGGIQNGNNFSGAGNGNGNGNSGMGYGGGRGGNNNFTNQQRNGFSGRTNGNAEDSAYFRQPVNPHRHQGRRNVQRPTDYREI